MQLVLIEPRAPLPPPSVAREAARIARPWALLACGAVAYLAYTAYDGLPALLHQQERAVETLTAAVVPQPPQPVAAPQAVQMVTKCVEDGVTSYSDRPCAPGADAEGIILAPDTAFVGSKDSPLQQACAELAEQERTLDRQAALAPSAAVHAWLDARRQETRGERARLAC